MDLTDNAEFGLYWAYWADEPADANGGDIINFARAFDISFSRFEQTGKWGISPEGYLVTQSADEGLKFAGEGLHRRIPVFSVNVRNGSGTIAISHRGETDLIHLTGQDKDPALWSSYSDSVLADVLESLLWSITISGVFSLLLQILSLLLTDSLKAILAILMKKTKSDKLLLAYRNTIELIFVPEGFLAGSVISAISFAAVLIWFLASRKNGAYRSNILSSENRRPEIYKAQNN